MDFGCSIVTDFKLTMFGFSAVSDCWVIVFVCFIGFENLVAVFGFIVGGLKSKILDFSTVFDSLIIFFIFVFKP